MATETLGAHLRNLLSPYKTLLNLVNDVLNRDLDMDVFKKINCDNINELIEFSHSEKMENTIWRNEKEFDFNKEIDEQIRLLGGVHKLDNDSKRWYTGTYEELFHFARHFIELGLKAKSMLGNNDSNPSHKKFD
jgi:hypothetical protein